MDHPHGDAGLGSRKPREIGLGADDREGAAVDFRAVFDVGGPHGTPGVSGPKAAGNGGTREITPVLRAAGRSFHGINPSDACA